MKLLIIFSIFLCNSSYGEANPRFVKYLDKKLKEYHLLKKNHGINIKSKQQIYKESNDKFLSLIKNKVPTKEYERIKKGLKNQESKYNDQIKKEYLTSIKSAKRITDPKDLAFIKGLEGATTAHLSDLVPNSKVVQKKQALPKYRPQRVISSVVGKKVKNNINALNPSTSKFSFFETNGRGSSHCFNNDPISYHNCLMGLSVSDIKKVSN